MNNIVIVGFMGTGKTTYGKKLAIQKNMPFIDTDDLIVERTGLSIPEIFSQKGEEWFRAIEAQICHSLLKYENTIIATGGGIILSESNRNILRQLGEIVYLEASVDEIYTRISNDTEVTRPLLKTQNPKESIRKLLEARRPLYESLLS